MFTQSPAEKQYKGSSENYAHTQQHTRASPATVSFHCHLPDLYSETPFFLKPQQLHNFNQPHTLSHFAASKWIYRTSRLWRLCLAAAFTWVLRIFNLQVDEFLFTWCQAEHPAVQIRLWVAPGSHNSNLATEVESGVSVEFNLIVVTVERWIRTFNALKKKIPSNPICRWHENSWDQMITYCRGTIDEEMADCSDCWVSSPVLEVPDSIVPDSKYYET